MIVPLTIVADIFFTSLLFYVFYRFFKGTHSAAVAKGLLASLLVYFIAVRLNLSTLTWIFDRLITNFPILVAIIFHQELRRFFASIGTPKGKMEKREIFIKTLGETLVYMSKNRIGALIVVEDKSRLDEFIENGVILDAWFSQELVLTIFHTGTDLHDGAVIIRGEKIYAAQVFLPTDFSHSTHKGTRHEAGVQITRGHSCVSLIVSEESGDISVARSGELTGVSRRKVDEVLHEIFS